MQEADENCFLNFGAVAVAPVEEIVVVPEVTALIVVCPAPIWITFITDPVGKATLALVGIKKSLALATDIVTNLFRLSVNIAV